MIQLTWQEFLIMFETLQDTLRFSDGGSAFRYGRDMRIEAARRIFERSTTPITVANADIGTNV